MSAFSLLTLNCFGVPTPVTNRRLRTIARELNRADYSVVCLQEVQLHAYRRRLSLACASYPASAHEPFLHAPKGGLLTLARAPLEGQTFELYRERRVVTPLALMDWALHKGVLLTRLVVAGVPVVVLNTHLSANYRLDWRSGNPYARVERAQLLQLAEIVQAQPPEALVVVAGDFNFPRGCWLYDELLAASGMTDPLAGDARPTHRMPLGLPERLALPIDFTLLRLPPLPALRVTSDLRYREQASFEGGGSGYLSDHFGVEVRVSWAA